MSILRARRENVHVNFHCRACATFKLLLHPIVRGYTRKCAANIVEKYKLSLVVG